MDLPKVSSLRQANFPQRSFPSLPSLLSQVGQESSSERKSQKHNNMIQKHDMIQLEKKTETLKFLCSYGGKIFPRSTDGKLRYVGGLTRVFSVERSISFAELMVKLGEFCGYSVTLRCRLPNGDLDTLISIKSDEDLANLIEEYDRDASTSKIRAILTPPSSLKQISPSPSVDSSESSPSFRVSDRRSSSHPSSPSSPAFEYPVYRSRPFSPPSRYPVSGKVCRYPCYVQGNPRSLYCGPHTHWH